ncbi:hypothetical protein PFISCL1PPCAC_4186, partial [Pristionchus fissidentatus]
TPFVDFTTSIVTLSIDFSAAAMSTVKVVRGARILTAELYGEPREKLVRPPRTVFFKCPERGCGFEHAQWSLVAQHLFHHHGYSQDLIDLEECEQRKTRRNKSWLKKRLATVAATSPIVDEDGNVVEDENQENEVDVKPSPVVLEAMLKLVPRGNGAKDMCTCPLEECAEQVPNRVELIKHARTKHIDHPTASGTFDIRTELFENEDDFRDWKCRLEDEFGMYYSCESTSQANGCKHFFYVCHRSGRVVRRMRMLREARHAERARKAEALDLPLSPPKRRLKVVKSQEYCTAFMRARRDLVGRFHVAYSTSHIGHDQDPAMLPLTPIMKKIIYDRIVAEHGSSSMSLIASRIRDACPDASSRLHYVSMTDVIEVIRMERKRLARVGGEEAANALDIFTHAGRKGRRKMGEELLMRGERHRPPRYCGGVGVRGGGGVRAGRRGMRPDDEQVEEEEMDMDSKEHLLGLRGQRTIK